MPILGSRRPISTFQPHLFHHYPDNPIPQYPIGHIRRGNTFNPSIPDTTLPDSSVLNHPSTFVR